jgi:hypothetical protein
MAGYANPFSPGFGAPQGPQANRGVSAMQADNPAAAPAAGDPPLDPADWTDWYLNNEPTAGWVAFLQSQGLYGLDPRSNWARNQYGRMYGQFQSAASQDPNLGFYDWLRASGLGLGGEYDQLAPTTRGDFSDRTVSNRARFMRAY